MPRPKGSKNKAKAPKNTSLDALIAEASETVTSLEEEVNAIEAEIAEQNAKLKALKSDLKKATKKLLPPPLPQRKHSQKKLMNFSMTA